jgi:hypothetical protein
MCQPSEKKLLTELHFSATLEEQNEQQVEAIEDEE